jgi:hypothetical protein
MAVIDETLDNAVRESFKKRGHMMPTLFADAASGERMVIGAPELAASDMETKQRARRGVKLMLLSAGVKTYVLATEAWIAEYKAGPDGKLRDLDDYPRPSETPDKIEALLIHFVSPAGKAMRIYKILRDGDKIELELFKEADDECEMKGPLTELLP